jgi:phosphoribosylaminoimidazole-succinocarboxamide synthase
MKTKLIKTLMDSDFNFQGQISKYKGKVRDVYYLNNDYVVMISSDRLSAFDVVMKKGIPFKGQILNQIAVKMLNETSDIVPNWLINSPDKNVSIGHLCIPIKIEMVIRGYLAGHSARQYKDGIREICGVKMPEGMIENDRFDSPIITPATKADQGHDEDISKNKILEKGIVTEKDYNIIENYTYLLFKRGSEIAKKRGLILVDTKYEFGKKNNGDIMLIDEIHTPDSSRFFYDSDYEMLQKKNEPQKQLSKEFVRQWLLDKGFQGIEGQSPPELNDEYINLVSERYIELYEKITGEKFVKGDTGDIIERINTNVNNYFSLKTNL